MAYKRKGRKTYYFQARTREGFKQLSTGIPLGDRKNEKRADDIERMWVELAKAERAWTLLDPVLAGNLDIGKLWDLWRETKHDVAEMKRRVNDTDLEPLVNEFLGIYKRQVAENTEPKVRQHLRWLVPADTTSDDGKTTTHQPFLKSMVTKDFLTKRLYAYPGAPGTTRRVASDWSVFFAYCTETKELFDENPMDRVKRPKQKRTVVRFYELDIVEQIVNWQPTAERKALFALLYGAALEISVALNITRAQIDKMGKEVDAPGTKTHTRDRTARIADWAWPIIWAHARALLPGARLFPKSWSRYTASDWHRQTIGAVGRKDTTGQVIQPGLNLAVQLPMHCARHHWAVIRLRAGVDIQTVQHQLGHASATITLNVYGKYLPKKYNRDRAEEQVMEYEAERRRSSADDGAEAQA